MVPWCGKATTSANGIATKQWTSSNRRKTWHAARPMPRMTERMRMHRALRGCASSPAWSSRSLASITATFHPQSREATLADREVATVNHAKAIADRPLSRNDFDRRVEPHGGGRCLGFDTSPRLHAPSRLPHHHGAAYRPPPCRCRRALLCQVQRLRATACHGVLLGATAGRQLAASSQSCGSCALATPPA